MGSLISRSPADAPISTEKAPALAFGIKRVPPWARTPSKSVVTPATTLIPATKQEDVPTREELIAQNETKNENIIKLEKEVQGLKELNELQQETIKVFKSSEQPKSIDQKVLLQAITALENDKARDEELIKCQQEMIRLQNEIIELKSEKKTPEEKIAEAIRLANIEEEYITKDSKIRQGLGIAGAILGAVGGGIGGFYIGVALASLGVLTIAAPPLGLTIGAILGAVAIGLTAWHFGSKWLGQIAKERILKIHSVSI